MINFDFLTLKSFLEENIDFLQGARIQKIQQPTRQDFVFTLRNNSLTRKLYINISSNFFHICFMSEQNEKKRGIVIPKHPPMFCMLLRKYLEGAKVCKVLQPEQERILEFYFETYNELGEKIFLCLAIELMGKHSNVILYNFDTNIILGCAHNVGAEKSSIREIIGWLPYAYPPRAVRKDFAGLFQLIDKQESANDFVDNHFAKLQEARLFETLKTKLSSGIKTKLKKNIASVEKLQQQFQKSSKSQDYKKKADLIMANLYNLKDFSSDAEVFDYEINASLKIELDKNLTLIQNANKFYKLYNKAKTANMKSQQMLSSLVSEKQYLEQVEYFISQSCSLSELKEIENEVSLPEISQKEKKNETSLPEARQIQGKDTIYNIYIGKNNKQNDYIVSKLAKDEDFWFHVHNCAGSHVLLKQDGIKDFPDEIIVRCAEIAKEFSAAKNSTKAGVIYTKAKYLKKPPKTNLGYVTYKMEKEIVV